VLSVFECLLLDEQNQWMVDEGYLLDIFLTEMEKAILKESAFELVWHLYFCCRHSIDIDLSRLVATMKREGKLQTSFSELNIMHNPFVATLRNKMPKKAGSFPNPFGDASIAETMFIAPKDLQDVYLVNYLDVFNTSEPEH
jgi:hypothetical protein